MEEDGIWMLVNHSYHYLDFNALNGNFSPNGLHYNYDYDYDYVPWDYGFNLSEVADIEWDPDRDVVYEAMVKYYMPCILAVGFAANLTALVILLSTPLRRTSKGTYLASVALADLLFLLLTMLRTQPLVGVDLLNSSDAACKTFVYFLHLSDCGHVLTTVTILDHYAASAFPRSWRCCEGWRPALLITLVVSVVLAAYSSHAIPHVSVATYGDLSLCHYHDYRNSMKWYMTDLILLNATPCVLMTMLSLLMVITACVRRRAQMHRGDAGVSRNGVTARVFYMPERSVALVTTSSDRDHISGDSTVNTSAPPTGYDWLALPLSLTALALLTALPYTVLHFYNLYVALHHEYFHKKALHQASVVISHLYTLVHALKLFLYIAFWPQFRGSIWAQCKGVWYRIAGRGYSVAP